MNKPFNQETDMVITAGAQSERRDTLFGLANIARGLFIAQISASYCTLLARLKLALLGCSCGPGLRVDGRIIICARQKAAITIGERVCFNSRIGSNLVGLTNPTILHCIRNGRIEIGDDTGCSSVVISARTRVSIGRHVKIGGNVRIFDHDYHSIDATKRRDGAQDREHVGTAPVVIGDDVFIGTMSLVLKGVTIGPRSIIGAGSVVTLKSIPADSLVAGNPARIVRQLA